MVTQGMVRKFLAEKAAIAQREAAEREKRAEEERKRAEAAEQERIGKVIRDYLIGRDEIKARERELSAIDKQIHALGEDMSALQSRWDGFTNSRAAHVWRQELKTIPTPGVERPNRIPPGFSARDMERLEAHAALRKQRAPVDGLLTDARNRVRKLEESEPALRVIGETK